MTVPVGNLPTGLSGRVLDTPAIIDLATGRSRYMRAVAYMAALNGDTLAVPAAALAQASATLLSDSERGHLVRAAAMQAVVVVPLGRSDAADAIEVGELATKQRLSIPAAHVAHVASARRWTIITRTEDAKAWRDLGYIVDVLP